MGQVMGTTAQRMGVSLSPKVAEAMTILKGIEFTVESGLVPVLVESDSLGVVTLINSGTPNLAEIGLICKDVGARIFEGLLTGV
ncbi:hypothetical protein Dsin_021743 [Dipteronia sinensis]|uniref:RNase H type-1 domain-containing protein n=1 Tax=Dipteronia sinensis TaxID=43782 RepID=A0AAE0A049_9ROSI|nr:hypothetical protein Dsin_021743 [Dipteronia sinensis]